MTKFLDQVFNQLRERKLSWTMRIAMDGKKPEVGVYSQGRFYSGSTQVEA